jgi:uncharacterized coiled-coil DUF342 family protein
MRQLDHYQGAGRKLGTGSLERLRMQLCAKINADPQLNRSEKRRVIQELDFLITHERLRRVQQATHQWRNVELDHQINVLQKVHETVNKIRSARAETDLVIAKVGFEILNYRTQLVERFWQFHKRVQKELPPRDTAAHGTKAMSEEERELQREELLHAKFARRALNRANFAALVKKDFPDLAEELLDLYDQQVFASGVSR